jgi:hypothetical protein
MEVQRTQMLIYTLVLKKAVLLCSYLISYVEVNFPIVEEQFCSNYVVRVLLLYMAPVRQKILELCVEKSSKLLGSKNAPVIFRNKSSRVLALAETPRLTSSSLHTI